MKNLQIFLNNPNLFFSRLAPCDKTLGVCPVDALRSSSTIDGENKLPTGILLSWGSPGTSSSGNQYGYRRTVLPIAATRSVKKQRMNKQIVEETFTHNLEIGSQYTIGTHGGASYSSDTGKRNFSRIVLNDARNRVYMENIPGLTEKLAAFAKRTHGWWLPNEGAQADGRNTSNRHRSNNQVNHPHLVDVTSLMNDEIAAGANKALDECIDMLTKEQLREWELFTHCELDFHSHPSPMPYVYRPRKSDDPTATPGDGSQDELPAFLPSFASQAGALKIRSWESKERETIGNEPIVGVMKSGFNHMSNFNIKLVEQNRHISEYRIHAVFDWECVSYSHDCKMVKRNNRGYVPPGGNRNGKIRQTTSYKLYMPRVTGFVIEIIPEEAKGGYYVRSENQFGNSENTLNPHYKVENLSRVADRTKKRSVKGGYRGGYQGIEKLKYNEVTLVEHILVSGLQQFAKGQPIRSFDKRVQKRIPLSLKQYQKIERPEVDIKPLEVGHLRLYRLSSPPKRQVSADILSDLLLPSMPDLLIATDSDIRVTSSDDYITGENCSGKCAKDRVEVTIPPGLYLVDRQEKCALGHDPGRSEYTAAFGDTCNEIITIRRMLSQLNVFYDEFRGNMVGSTNRNTLSTMNATDNSAFLGRLG